MLRDLAIVYARVLCAFGIASGFLVAFAVPVYPPSRGPVFLLLAALTACGVAGGRPTRRPALVFACVFLALAALGFVQGQGYERTVQELGVRQHDFAGK